MPLSTNTYLFWGLWQQRKNIDVWVILGPSEKNNYGQNFDVFSLPVISQKKPYTGTEWSFVSSVLCMKNSVMRTWAQMCAHRSITEYEHTHTTEGTEKVSPP